MDLIRKNEKIFVYLILSTIIFLGFYLCFIGGYGSDEDTLPMIYVFEAKLDDLQSFASFHQKYIVFF